MYPSRFSQIWYMLKTRYGLSAGSVICLAAALVCSTAYRYTGLRILRLGSLLLILAAALIIFLRMPVLRQRLRERAARASASAAESFRAFRRRRQDKEHRYYRCPQCSKMLRVPRGRGRIEIKCRCGRTFFRRT